MELKSVVLLDCLPNGVVRADIPGRTQFDAARDGVTLVLHGGCVFINGIGVPLSRVQRFEARCHNGALLEPGT
jgi:hypothetical protein